MDRGTPTGGTIKCRKFTLVVDLAQTMSVVSATLTGLYCALISAPLRAVARICQQKPLSSDWRRNYYALAGLAACALFSLHPGTARAQRANMAIHRSVIETGAASYYGRRHQGRRTASGLRFNDKALTAAHPWLPFGTKVRVTLLSTGRSVVVEITDRLHSSRRIVDLSLGAARALGMVRQGVAMVVLSPG
jgi:rare lipoprotein A